MLLTENIKHTVINSPVDGLARKLRNLIDFYKGIRHPELKEIYAESSRIEIAMGRIIKKSMNCIDVGADLGSMLSVMKRLSPNGKHIAIEPIPYKHRWLEQKFPDLKILQIALSDTVGEFDFFLQTERSSFSGLRLHNPGNTEKKIEILKVNCQKLDDIVPFNLPIGFIKIDVEGGELAVLQGGENTLKNYRPTILFECTQSGLMCHNISTSDVYNFFKTYSYSIFLIKDWLENRKALNYEQFAKAIDVTVQGSYETLGL